MHWHIGRCGCRSWHSDGVLMNRVPGEYWVECLKWLTNWVSTQGTGDFNEGILFQIYLENHWSGTNLIGSQLVCVIIAPLSGHWINSEFESQMSWHHRSDNHLLSDASHKYDFINNVSLESLSIHSCHITQVYYRLYENNWFTMSNILKLQLSLLEWCKINISMRQASNSNWETSAIKDGWSDIWWVITIYLSFLSF